MHGAHPEPESEKSNALLADVPLNVINLIILEQCLEQNLTNLINVVKNVVGFCGLADILNN